MEENDKKTSLKCLLDNEPFAKTENPIETKSNIKYNQSIKNKIIT